MRSISMTKMSIILGVVFCISLYFTSFFGAIVCLTPFLPLIKVHPKLGRWILDFFVALWKSYAVAWFELVFGVKIIVQGEPADINESVLIIMNHRTRLDWLFLFAYEMRCGSLPHFKITLKDMLKSIPGPGWAMQCDGFLFLRRKWELDAPLISRCIQYFHGLNYPLQILLFPEGTDMTKNTMKRSDQFAEKNKLEKFHYVLHPRVRGFVHMVNEMRKGRLDSVLDITVGYPRTMAFGELDLLMGKLPEEIHFNVQRFPAASVPEDEEKIEEWCRLRWAKKEVELKDFYEKKRFESPPRVECWQPGWVLWQQWSALVFWLVFQVVVTWALFAIPLFRWYCVLSMVTYLFIGWKHGGVDFVLFQQPPL